MHRRIRSRLLLLALLTLNAACPLGAQDSYGEVEILGRILSGAPSQCLAYLGQRNGMAALALLPERSVLHELLAAVLWQGAKRDSALAESRESVRLQPNRFRGHLLRGSALSRTGDLNASVTEYREALRLKPASAILHKSLGPVLHEKSETDAAISEYREAIRLWPDYFEAHFKMGNAFLKKGEWSEARARFRATVRINPGFQISTITWVPHSSKRATLRAPSPSFARNYGCNPRAPLLTSILTSRFFTVGRIRKHSRNSGSP
jgi:tetratricopeptide (TPR) repeat protein